MDKAIQGLIDDISKALGTDPISIDGLNICVKHGNNVDYTCVCNDTDELYNTLFDMLNGIISQRQSLISSQN